MVQATGTSRGTVPIIIRDPSPGVLVFIITPGQVGDILSVLVMDGYPLGGTHTTVDGGALPDTGTDTGMDIIMDITMDMDKVSDMDTMPEEGPVILHHHARRQDNLCRATFIKTEITV